MVIGILNLVYTEPDSCSHDINDKLFLNINIILVLVVSLYLNVK